MSGTWRYTFTLHQLTIVCKQANSYIALIVEYYDTILFSTILLWSCIIYIYKERKIIKCRNGVPKTTQTRKEISKLVQKWELVVT